MIAVTRPGIRISAWNRLGFPSRMLFIHLRCRDVKSTFAGGNTDRCSQPPPDFLQPGSRIFAGG